MNWSAAGAILLGLGVILGAFGAHALSARLGALATAGVWEKAVFYQFLHAMGILVVPVLARTGTLPRRSAATVCGAMAAGIALFSGSLYVLALTGDRMLGAITPLGGLCFIAAWAMLAWHLRRID